jgi:hypothetical protein
MASHYCGSFFYVQLLVQSISVHTEKKQEEYKHVYAL